MLRTENIAIVKAYKSNQTPAGLGPLAMVLPLAAQAFQYLMYKGSSTIFLTRSYFWENMFSCLRVHDSVRHALAESRFF